MTYTTTVCPFPERPYEKDEIIREVSFPDHLDNRTYPNEPFPGDGYHQLLGDYRMLYKREGETNFTTLTAPRGMFHDFASIPNIVSILPDYQRHEGPHVPSSIIHDKNFLAVGDWIDRFMSEARARGDDRTRAQILRSWFYFSNRVFSAGMAHFGTRRDVRSNMFNAVNSAAGWRLFVDFEPFTPLMHKWEALLDEPLVGVA